MALKYTNIFHSHAPQNIPDLGFLVLKVTIRQPSLSSLFSEKNHAMEGGKLAFWHNFNLKILILINLNLF
jgi:hypothetical protein